MLLVATGRYCSTLVYILVLVLVGTGTYVWCIMKLFKFEDINTITTKLFLGLIYLHYTQQLFIHS